MLKFRGIRRFRFFVLRVPGNGNEAFPLCSARGSSRLFRAETFRPAMGKAPEIQVESAESPGLKKMAGDALSRASAGRGRLSSRFPRGCHVHDKGDAGSQRHRACRAHVRGKGPGRPLLQDGREPSYFRRLHCGSSAGLRGGFFRSCPLEAARGPHLPQVLKRGAAGSVPRPFFPAE